MNIGDEFSRMLGDTADRLGVDLKVSSDAAKQYAAGQMVALSMAADEPGYADVLQAAGLSVALFAAGRSVDVADAADAEFVGLITGALGIGARAMLA